MDVTWWLRKLSLLAALAGVVILVLGATVGTGISAIDTTASDVASGAESVFSNEPLDRGEIERAAHRAVNEERRAAGVGAVSFDTDLRDVGRDHSSDMASNDYFSHTAPDGTDHTDRYAEFGINCGASAENIAWTVADGDVKTDGGTVNHNRNETSIGQGLVRQWMNSPRHRDILLSSQWQTEGIGVATAETDNGTRVYATQNFCE